MFICCDAGNCMFCDEFHECVAPCISIVDGECKTYQERRKPVTMPHYTKHLATLPRKTINIYYDFDHLPEDILIAEKTNFGIGYKEVRAFIIGDLAFVEYIDRVEIWTGKEEQNDE